MQSSTLNERWNPDRRRIKSSLFGIALLLLMLVNCLSSAQAPQKMSYQAVVRNASNSLVSNQSVGVRISILRGAENGVEVFKEIYNPNPQTNANGLITIEIGSGIASVGTFATIDWANGPYFLKTETDPAGGTNYTITTISQLLSVPYALHAKTASTFAETDPLFDTSVAKNITNADITSWNNKLGVEEDGDPGNELITNISATGTKIAIAEGSNIHYAELKFLQYDTIPFPNSLILSHDEQVLLNKWIGNVQQKWSACYIKSRDGASSTTFHNNCNFKGPSVTVIKLSNGNVFGGYNSGSWSSAGAYSGYGGVFLFSVTNHLKFPLGNDYSNSVYSAGGYGPTFGGGHDIFVNASMNLGYCYFPYSFCSNGITKTPSNSYSQLLCGLNTMTAADIVELEVWILDY